MDDEKQEDAVKRFYRLYAVTDGRTGRFDYWLPVLVTVAVTLVVCVAAAMLPPLAGDLLVVVWLLGTVVPVYCGTVRRLHDSGHRAAWAALIAALALGGAVLIGVCETAGLEGTAFTATAAAGILACGLSLFFWVALGSMPGKPDDPARIER